MKSKLKDPLVAKKKGFAHVKNSVKKKLKEEIIEPVSFFYDSEFDYEGEDGKMPLMYIGDIPSLWKNYVKLNKTSKTLVAGRCLFKDDVLSLEIKLGKGGKNPVLKQVNKMLLKPFAKAQFVDSLEGPLVAVEDSKEDTTKDDQDTEFDTSSTDLLIAEAKEFIALANKQKETLEGIVKDLGPKVADIGAKPITDAVIKEAMNALFTVHALDTNNFLVSIAAWVKSVPSDVSGKNKELADLVAQVAKLEKEVITVDAEMDKLAINCEKLEKVQNPMDSAEPPVDDKASSMLKNSFSKLSIHTKEFANKTDDMFKVFDKA